MGRHAAEPTGEIPILDGPQRVYFRPPVPRTDEQPVVTPPIDDEAFDDDAPPLSRLVAWALIGVQVLFTVAAWLGVGALPHPGNLWCTLLLLPALGIELAVDYTRGWP